MFSKEGAANQSVSWLERLLSIDPSGLMGLIINAGLVILLFAFGSGVYIKLKRELKKIERNGHNGGHADHLKTQAELYSIQKRLDKIFQIIKHNDANGHKNKKKF